MGNRIVVPLALDDLEVIDTVLVDGMLEVRFVRLFRGRVSIVDRLM